MKNLILFVFFVVGVSTLYVSNSYSSSVGGGGSSLPSCANESYVLTYSTSSSSYSCAAASGSVTGLTAPLATDGVYRIVSNGGFELSGGGGLGKGGNIVLQGQNATNANDFQVRAGTTNVMFWDDSANTMIIGLNSNTTTSVFGSGLALNRSGASGTKYSITSGIATGSVQISSGTGAGDGGSLELYGNSHATLADDFAFRDTAGGAIMYWDDSAALMTFRKDTNGTNRTILRNTDAGSLAKSQLSFSTTAGDFNITALSSVGGGTVNVVGDATFNGGMNISQLGSGGIFVKTNNITRLTVPTTGVVAIASDGTVNGSQIASAANTLTLTNKTIDADGTGNSITNIENADIKAAAAIALAKLAAGTASRAVAFSTNGFLEASATTATELGYVNGVTSAIQTQINAKLASTGFVESWAMVVPVATDGSYPIHPGDSVARQVKNVKGKCGAGVATGIFKLNTTTIDSLGTFAFTTAYSTVAAGTGANNDWSADTPLSVTLTTAGTCTNLQFRVESTRD